MANCLMRVMFLLSFSVWLIRGFCFLSHFLKEIGVARSNSCRTGVIGAKHLFMDSQGSLHVYNPFDWPRDKDWDGDGLKDSNSGVLAGEGKANNQVR